MPTRTTYWAHSNFAAWIVDTFGGVKRPSSGTAEEWVQWRKDAKRAHFSYWFTEVFLDKLQDIVYWPNDQLSEIRYYFFNRFITKTHYLRTGLKPGSWHEFDTRLLHGMFEELVDFIEIEKAWMMVVWDDEKHKQYNTPWWRTTWRVLRWKEWRSAQAGLDHLAWEIKLVYDKDMGVEENDPQYGQPTPQAVSAQQQLDLYNWWKNIRPNRPDPYDASGWTALCAVRREAREGDDDIMSLFVDDNTEEMKVRRKYSLDELNRLEQQYDEEDTKMMIKLVEIRQHLWT